tara:strand:- start:1286 stop:1465 length:180 start_codon:yes stop_codon:yes gene_type:complete
MQMDKELKNRLEKIELKLDKLQLTLDKLEGKLGKHIDFIDETYEGLRNPINAAKKFLGR